MVRNWIRKEFTNFSVIFNPSPSYFTGILDEFLAATQEKQLNIRKSFKTRGLNLLLPLDCAVSWISKVSSWKVAMLPFCFAKGNYWSSRNHSINRGKPPPKLNKEWWTKQQCRELSVISIATRESELKKKNSLKENKKTILFFSGHLFTYIRPIKLYYV